ncbi:glycosyltransferase [bacterium]|nr:glycosyltransferase [bacterium]
MNILVFNTLAETFGSTVRCRLMVRCLREMGHQVFYSEARPSSQTHEILIDQHDSLWGYLGSTWTRRAVLKKHAFCDLIIFSKLNPLIVPLLHQAARMRLTYLVDWDDLDSWFQTSILRSWLTRMVETRWPAKIPLLTTHNDELKRYAEELRCSRVFLVPQVVDTELFNPARYDRNETRSRLGIKPDQPCVGLSLTFTQGGARDLGLVLKAFSRLEAEHIPLSLLIIGDGPHKKFYQQLAMSLGLTRVIWSGWVPWQDMPRFLNVCDLGLIMMRDDPGNHYRFSLKILEYMSMNIPILGHLTGATATAFDRFLTESVRPDERALAEALERWYKRFCNQGTPSREGATGTRAEISRHYGLMAMKEALQLVLDHVVNIRK